MNLILNYLDKGLANIFAPLFGGVASTGAIARTATNIRQGGNSPVAGIVHAITLGAILLFFSPICSVYSVGIYGSHIICSSLQYE